MYTHDPITGAEFNNGIGYQMGVDFVMVHRGQAFDFSISGTIAAGGTAYLLGVTNGRDVHFQDMFIKTSRAPFTIEFFEEPAASSLGTKQVTHNRNRHLATPATLDVYTGPTVTEDGTRLFVNKILQAGGPPAGGNLEFPGKWVLENGTNYIFKLTNGDAQNAVDFVAGFFWYEPH